MANGIHPSSSNSIPSSSVEKTSSFGWLDTALFVGGTLFCGAWFGPACGLVYAFTYLAGKEIDGSFLKEKQVLPVEKPNAETQKTSAAASQILAPSLPEPAPIKVSISSEKAPGTPPVTPGPISVTQPLQKPTAPLKDSNSSEKASVVSLETQKTTVSQPPQQMAALIQDKNSLEKTSVALQAKKSISVPQPIQKPAASINNLTRLENTPKPVIAPITQKIASGQSLNTASIPQVPHKSAPTQVFPLKGGGQQTVSKVQAKQTNWLKSFFTPRIPGGPPGVPNQGNSCFAASVFHLIADHSIFTNHLVGILKDGPKAFFQKWLPIYQEEKAKGKAQSLIPINEMRRLLPGSGGRIQGYAQEDAESLIRGIFGPVSIQIDSCPFISLETLQQQHKDLLKNPLLRIKTEQKTWFVGDASLEGTDFVRYESNPQYAYSMKRSIEVPILNVNFLMDEKGQMVNLPLPLLLEQNYFTSKPTVYDEPYKLKNGRIALLQSTQITFDKPPVALIIALSRFKNDQKIKTPVETPLNLTLPSNGTENRATAEYELAGTVIHDGEFNAGHYIAEGVSFDSKGQPRIWHSDDSRVNPITLKDFENNAAHSYLQLYVQKTAKK